MITNYLYIIPTLVLLFGGSCSQRNAPENISVQYFSGKFLIDSETGDETFTDCANYLTMEVLDEGDMDKLRKEYSLIYPTGGYNLFIEFTGKIIRNESHIDEDIAGLNPPAVIIDSLVSLDRNTECRTDFILSGIYQADDLKEKNILRIRPDYTYTQSSFIPEEGKDVTGVWYRSSLLILVLKPDGKDEEITFQIMPTQNSLAQNSGNGSLIYKKVYL